MPYGVSMEHTTLPKDGSLTFDPSGVQHVIVAGPLGPEVEQLLAEARSAGHDVTLLHTGSAGTAEVVDQLGALLAAAQVGIRVYLAGDDGFVRATAAVAHAAGVLDDELQTAVTASAARRVWCSHCRTVTEGVTTTVAPCAGCGRTLEVFHHFSRRHGAYLGFQADAEAPGELPDPEVAWP